MDNRRLYIKFNDGGMGAWIYVNPSQPIEGALLNPDTSKVRKLPPEFWKLVDSKIVPMTMEERQQVASVDKREHFLRRVKHVAVDRPVEVIKEVPIEIIREVPVEVIREVPVEKIVNTVTIKEVKVPVEIPKLIRVEVPVEVVKEVEKFIEVEKIVYRHNKLYLVIAGLALLLQLYNAFRSNHGG